MNNIMDLILKDCVPLPLYESIKQLNEENFFNFMKDTKSKMELFVNDNKQTSNELVKLFQDQNLTKQELYEKFEVKSLKNLKAIDEIIIFPEHIIKLIAFDVVEKLINSKIYPGNYIPAKNTEVDYIDSISTLFSKQFRFVFNDETNEIEILIDFQKIYFNFFDSNFTTISDTFAINDLKSTFFAKNDKEIKKEINNQFIIDLLTDFFKRTMKGVIETLKDIYLNTLNLSVFIGGI